MFSSAPSTSILTSRGVGVIGHSASNVQLRSFCLPMLLTDFANEFCPLSSDRYNVTGSCLSQRGTGRQSTFRIWLILIFSRDFGLATTPVLETVHRVRVGLRVIDD